DAHAKIQPTPPGAARTDRRLDRFGRRAAARLEQPHQAISQIDGLWRQTSTLIPDLADRRARQTEGRYVSMYSTLLVAAGTGKPSSRNPSTWNRFAERISCSTSATVAPVATQPGRSGT